MWDWQFIKRKFDSKMSKFNVNQTGQQVVLGRQKKDIRWIMLSKL